MIRRSLRGLVSRNRQPAVANAVLLGIEGAGMAVVQEGEALIGGVVHKVDQAMFVDQTLGKIVDTYVGEAGSGNAPGTPEPSTDAADGGTVYPSPTPPVSQQYKAEIDRALGHG